MPAPYEIIVGPASVYVAPVGEPFPDIDAVPAGNWELVGTLGSENYGEKGVIVRMPRTTTPINVLGSTMPRKYVITETGFEVEFDVLDATVEMLAYGFGVDQTDIVDTAAGSGDAGQRVFSVPTSPVPYQRAVLVRIDQSPYMENGKTQVEIYAANQGGAAEFTMVKDNAAMVTHLWQAVKTASGVANIRAQDAVAT